MVRKTKEAVTARDPGGEEATLKTSKTLLKGKFGGLMEKKSVSPSHLQERGGEEVAILARQPT
jgi:hypothetical protein